MLSLSRNQNTNLVLNPFSDDSNNLFLNPFLNQLIKPIIKLPSILLIISSSRCLPSLRVRLRRYQSLGLATPLKK